MVETESWGPLAGPHFFLYNRSTLTGVVKMSFEAEGIVRELKEILSKKRISPSDRRLLTLLIEKLLDLLGWKAEEDLPWTDAPE